MSSMSNYRMPKRRRSDLGIIKAEDEENPEPKKSRLEPKSGEASDVHEIELPASLRGMTMWDYVQYLKRSGLTGQDLMFTNVKRSDLNSCQAALADLPLRRTENGCKPLRTWFSPRSQLSMDCLTARFLYMTGDVLSPKETCNKCSKPRFWYSLEFPTCVAPALDQPQVVFAGIKGRCANCLNNGIGRPCMPHRRRIAQDPHAREGVSTASSQRPRKKPLLIRPAITSRTLSASMPTFQSLLSSSSLEVHSAGQASLPATQSAVQKQDPRTEVSPSTLHSDPPSSDMDGPSMTSLCDSRALGDYDVEGLIAEYGGLSSAEFVKEHKTLSVRHAAMMVVVERKMMMATEVQSKNDRLMVELEKKTADVAARTEEAQNAKTIMQQAEADAAQAKRDAETAVKNARETTEATLLKEREKAKQNQQKIREMLDAMDS